MLLCGYQKKRKSKQVFTNSLIQPDKQNFTPIIFIIINAFIKNPKVEYLIGTGDGTGDGTGELYSPDREIENHTSRKNSSRKILRSNKLIMIRRFFTVIHKEFKEYF